MNMAPTRTHQKPQAFGQSLGWKPLEKTMKLEQDFLRQMSKFVRSKMGNLSYSCNIREKKKCRRVRRRNNKAKAGKFVKEINSQGGWFDDVTISASETTFARFEQLIMRSFGELQKTTVNTVDEVKKAFSEAISSFDKTVNGVLQVAWVVPICALICYVATRPGMSVVAKMVIALLATVLPASYKMVIELIQNFVEDSTKIQSQSGLFDFESVRNIISVATVTGLCFKGASTIYSAIFNATELSENTLSLMGLVNASRKAQTDANMYTTFVQWGLSTVEDVINAIRKLFGSEESIKIFKTGKQRIDTWAEETGRIMTMFQTGKLELNASMAESLISLREEGYNLQNDYRFDKPMAPILERCFAKFDEFCSANAAVFSAMKGLRQQPHCMAIFGPPGIGKSALCAQICTYVMGRCMPKERLDKLVVSTSEVFQKDNGSYWNGYTGQFCYVMDDAFQQIDQNGATETDAMLIIKAVNTWPFPLNFADIQNKGKNDFRSKFFLLTTNVPNVQKKVSNVVFSPDAVLRRMHTKLQLGVTDAFLKKGKGTWDALALDFDKVTEYIKETERAGVPEFPFHAWVVREHYFDGRDNSKNPSMGLMDVLNRVCNSMIGDKEVDDLLSRAYPSTLKVAKAKRCDYGDNSDSGFKTPEIDEPTLHDSGSSSETPADYSFVPSLVPGEIEPQAGLLTRVAGGLLSSVTEVLMDRMYPGEEDEFEVVRDDKVQVVSTEDLEPHEYDEMCGPKTRLGKLAQDLMDSVNAAKMEMLTYLFDPIRYLKENPLLGTVITSVSVVALIALVRECFGGLLQRIFPGQDKKPKESQSLPFSKFKQIMQKGPSPMDVQDAVSRNLFRLTIYDETNETYFDLGNILALRQGCFIMNTHFSSQIAANIQSGVIKPTSQVYICNAYNNGIVVKATAKEFLTWGKIDFEDQDFSIVKSPCTICARDIVSKFFTASQHKSFTKSDCVLATTDRVGDRYALNMHHSQVVRSNKFDVAGGTVRYQVSKGFEYKIPTVAGDCGAVLMVGPSATWTQTKILGIHTGGVPSLSKGYSTVVTQEQIIEALDSFNAIESVDTDPTIQREVQADFSGSHMAIGAPLIPTSFRPTTRLFETDLVNKWGKNTMKPAKATPENMQKARAKYATPVQTYPQDLVNNCAHVAFERISKCTEDVPKSERKVLTIKEAVEGIPDMEFAQPLTRGTSAGYIGGCPFNGKKSFLGTDGPVELTSDYGEWLRTEVELIVKDAKENKRREHFFTDFPKDEKLPEHKVDAGKVRMVSGCPLPLLVATRMYFLSFQANMMRTRIDNGCAAGINPYSEWGYLRDYLLEMSNNIVAGDYSAFDSSEQPQLHYAILEYINSWYDDGPVNAQIRRVLWEDLVNSRHIGKADSGQVVAYQWYHSLPSGHPCTTIVNSMYNMLLITMCFCETFGVAKLKEFHNLVRFVVLGDDNVIAIDDLILRDFNQQTITKSMAKFHMTYTDENKGESQTTSQSIETRNFLKRGFPPRAEDGHAYAPLSQDTIKHLAYWCRNRREVEEVTQSNFETALMELSAHSKEDWDRIAPDMLAAYAESGRRTALLPVQATYRELYRSSVLTY